MAVQRFESIVSAQAVGTADIERLAASFDKLSGTIDKASENSKKISEHPGFSAFADKVKQGIENPLQAVGSAVGGLLTTLGPAGTALAGAAGVLGVIGKVGLDAARELGHLGDSISDTAVRMGLTTKEVGQFSFAMKYAGGDISTLEGGMRRLSQALDSGSTEGKAAREAMKELGISTRDVAGNMRPMSDIFLQLSDRLGAVGDTAKRNADAIKIFGRAGLEILPDLLELSEGVKRARELGLGPSQQEIDRWNDYHKKIAEADALWEKLKRQLKDPLAATVVVTLKWFTGSSSQNGPVAAAQAGKQSVPDEDSYQRYGDSLKQQGIYLDLPEALRRFMPPDAATAVAGGNADISSIGIGAAMIQRDQRQFEQLLAGAQFSYEKAKQNAERLRNEYFSLEGQAGEEAIQRKRKEWQEAEASARSLSEQVKLLGKEESRRLEMLERSRELRESGETYYSFPTAGGKTAFVTGSDIAKANGITDFAPKRTPSLIRGSSYPYNAEYTAAAPYAEGMQNVGAQSVFVSPESSRINVRGTSSGLQPWIDSERQRQEIALNGLRQQYAATQRIVELRAGPGGEFQAALTVAALRRQELVKEFAMTGDVVKYRQEAAQIELDQAVRVEEIRRQGRERYRSSVESGFDALVSGGRGGLSSFFQSQLMGVGRTAAGNLAEMTYSGMHGKLSLTNKPDSFMGKLLANTPFGADPLKAATEMNTLATAENTAALRSMAMSATGGGGGLVRTAGGVFSTVGSLGSLYNPKPGGNWWNNTPGEVPYDHADIPNNLDGTVTPASTGMSGTMRGLGIAGAGAAGAFGVYSGIRTGGGRGAVTAAGSALASAGAIMALASKTLSVAGPIGMLAGMGLGMLTSVFGDPKANRASDIDRQVKDARYDAPDSSTYTVDRYGRSYDYDTRGGMRPIVVNQYIQAMDAQNVIDRRSDIAQATIMSLTESPELAMAVKSTAYPR